MKQQKNYVQMTRDVVFKKFFVDNPEILKRVLKHFLNIPKIMDLEIKTPNIQDVRRKKNPQNKQRFEFVDLFLIKSYNKFKDKERKNLVLRVLFFKEFRRVKRIGSI
ncbi:MAG: hypothetical protein GDA46_02080 [Bdellovibrionales bacterium]|nr:hypothetical protein [Bdellovibrionales bacterium]